ncbi:unnamed protein product, partial [Rhizoctonia solani]
MKYTSNPGLFGLSEKWTVDPRSGELDPEPLLHGVLGKVYKGYKIVRVRLQNSLEPSDRPRLQVFAKELNSVRINNILDDITTQNIRRAAKYGHPNILSLYGIQPIVTAHNEIGIGLLLPPTSIHSLSEYIDTTPDLNRHKLCAQVSSGLAYLHKAGVIHGSFRAANILVSLNGQAIISDPLMLREHTLNDQPMQVRWMAPEILRNESPSRASDVYSLGMIVRGLAVQGCENLADQINVDAFDQKPCFKGGFGDVYRGSLNGSLQIAVKTPRSLLDILNESPESIKIVAREIRTWSKCDHPNVLVFLGLAEFRGKIGMIAPWMENGNLPDYLHKNPAANRGKL